MKMEPGYRVQAPQAALQRKRLRAVRVFGVISTVRVRVQYTTYCMRGHEGPSVFRLLRHLCTPLLGQWAECKPS